MLKGDVDAYIHASFANVSLHISFLIKTIIIDDIIIVIGI